MIFLFFAGLGGRGERDILGDRGMGIVREWTILARTLREEPSDLGRNLTRVLSIYTASSRRSAGNILGGKRHAQIGSQVGTSVTPVQRPMIARFLANNTSS